MADTDDTRPAQNWLDGRRERGIRAYARIFGVTEQEVPAAMAARVCPLFAEEAVAAAGGPAWSHPALTPRDRSIAVITALAAQGVTGERLDTHLVSDGRPGYRAGTGLAGGCRGGDRGLRLKRVRFMPLLETTLHKQVLRQAGAVYHFRHAALQDLLATHDASTPAGERPPRGRRANRPYQGPAHSNPSNVTERLTASPHRLRSRPSSRTTQTVCCRRKHV
jgi:hypothetical protein